MAAYHTHIRYDKPPNNNTGESGPGCSAHAEGCDGSTGIKSAIKAQKVICAIILYIESNWNQIKKV